MGLDVGSSLKSALVCYENRQYKKGLKLCDQLIKSGESLAEAKSLKGIILLNMDKKEEGLLLAKEGLKHKLSSGFCWHILGLCYRSLCNFEEALKCFKNSLKYDDGNMSVLKDTATCALHLQEYESAIEYRKTILLSRPSMLPNWLGLLLAYSLGGHYAEAKEVANCAYSILDCKLSTLGLELKRFMDHKFDTFRQSTISPQAERLSADFCSQLSLGPNNPAITLLENCSTWTDRSIADVLKFLKRSYSEPYADKLMENIRALPLVKRQIITASIEQSRGNFIDCVGIFREYLLCNPDERTIRSRLIKCLLMCNNEADADAELQKLFSARKENSTVSENICELQYIWVLMKRFMMHARQSNFESAILAANSIFDIANQFDNDVYDFHTYVLRKGAISAYVDCISSQQSIIRNRWLRLLLVFSFSIHFRIDAAPELLDSFCDLAIRSKFEDNLIKRSQQFINDEFVDEILLAKAGEFFVRKGMKYAALKALSRLGTSQRGNVLARIFEDRYDNGSVGLRLDSADELELELIELYPPSQISVPRFTPCSFKFGLSGLALLYIRHGRSSAVVKTLRDLIISWYPCSKRTIDVTFYW